MKRVKFYLVLFHPLWPQMQMEQTIHSVLLLICIQTKTLTLSFIEFTGIPERQHYRNR